ncbi:hypothetical protein EXN66_Car008797 [Channa argus]|uniref:Thrombopoietin n=1 Tax=Channa argus TaxID=215402 RepID=A0A6G1PS04_CHAAH|nr:hypothetical protein EXN66_Car008797 [Channa argus]
MACSRLLLLLIGLIISHLPEVQGAPIDFWCRAKNQLSKKIEVMDNCVGSDRLHSPLQLPCEGVQPLQWANKTLQQKAAEVLGAFLVFKDGVQRAINHTTSQTPSCQTSLLKKLEHRINNYVHILNNLPNLTNMETDTSQPAVQHCSSQTSLTEVLNVFTKLLSGKLRYLTTDLQDSALCKAQG